VATPCPAPPAESLGDVRPRHGGVEWSSRSLDKKLLDLPGKCMGMGQAPNTSLPTCTAFVDDRIVTLIIPVVVVAFVEAVVSVCVCRCDAVV